MYHILHHELLISKFWNSKANTGQLSISYYHPTWATGMAPFLLQKRVLKKDAAIGQELPIN